MMCFCWKYLFDEGKGNEIPGHNAVIHQLQESSESEGQHFTKTEESKGHMW